jgi:hypothetical protein
MKMKTKSKPKKNKVVKDVHTQEHFLIMQECIDQFKKDFNQYRKKTDYKTLGDMFWMAFILHPEGEFREAVDKLFASLSKKEIALLDREA